MVQFAAERISSGHLPWTSWFPYIGLGSPQFLHYQSLASVLTGLVAQIHLAGHSSRVDDLPAPRDLADLRLLVGPHVLDDPLGVGRSSRRPARSFRAYSCPGTSKGRTSSSGTALDAAVRHVVPSHRLGAHMARHQPGAHIILQQHCVVGLTICMHFETGYLALLPLVVWPWLVLEDLGRRIRSALRIGAGAFLVSAWAWVPLLAQRNWSGINSVLAGTQYQKGYGATTMLKWLVEGRIFDSGAVMPIVTLLGAVGFVVSIARWKTQRRGPGDLEHRGLLVPSRVRAHHLRAPRRHGPRPSGHLLPEIRDRNPARMAAARRERTRRIGWDRLEVGPGRQVARSARRWRRRLASRNDERSRPDGQWP